MAGRERRDRVGDVRPLEEPGDGIDLTDRIDWVIGWRRGGRGIVVRLGGFEGEAEESLGFAGGERGAEGEEFRAVGLGGAGDEGGGGGGP